MGVFQRTCRRLLIRVMHMHMHRHMHRHMHGGAPNPNPNPDPNPDPNPSPNLHLEELSVDPERGAGQAEPAGEVAVACSG